MSTSLHVLSKAIEGRRPAVVRCRSASGDAQLHVHFLVDGRPGGDGGFWAELADGDVVLIDRLVAGQSPVHVSFASGHSRIHFDTTLLLRRKPFMRGERLLLAWPAALRVAERRRSGREPAVDQVTVQARLRAGANDTIEHPLAVWDLTPGGGSFVFDPALLSEPLKLGQALNICLSYAGVDHWVAACPRHSQPLPDGRIRLGVEFDAGQSSILESSEWFQRALQDMRVLRERRSRTAGTRPAVA